jgi:hypothetical protein
MMILPEHLLQIYNECIHDLLAPPSQRGKPSALRLKEDKAGHIQVCIVHADMQQQQQHEAAAAA